MPDSITHSPSEAPDALPEDVPPEYSEDALGTAFTERYQDTYRYTAQWARWSRWDGVRWKPDTTLSVYDRARGICREAAARCENERLAQRHTFFPHRQWRLWNGWPVQTKSSTMTPQQWDGDSWALNTPSGIVDLRTGRLGPSRPLAYCSMMTPVGPGGVCPRWLAFLDRVTGGDDALASLHTADVRICAHRGNQRARFVLPLRNRSERKERIPEHHQRRHGRLRPHSADRHLRGNASHQPPYRARKPSGCAPGHRSRDGRGPPLE